MKIAVTYQDGDIFQHFGHTEFFKIYDIENTDIVKTEIVSTNGAAMARWHNFCTNTARYSDLRRYRRRRPNGMSQAGIKLYGGVTGKADEQ